MNSCQPETLPYDTENPIIKGKEHCKVITLRSRKQTREVLNNSPTSIPDQGESSKVDPIIKDGIEKSINVVTPRIIIHLPSVLQSMMSEQP
ncbi:hypothetical protein V6N13_009217 [Hibiscus sabdariffa]|uniref:Uncharacterized protein n=2 Tax=Hibiscus sabdariffa TaxID=183260 RepID=A0ABR2DHY5_9ROSI